MIQFICGDRRCWKHFHVDVLPTTRFPLTCPACRRSLYPADMLDEAASSSPPGAPPVPLLWALVGEGRDVEPVPSASRARAHGLPAAGLVPDPARWSERDLHPGAFDALVHRASVKRGGTCERLRPRQWRVELPRSEGGSLAFVQGLNLLEDGRIELTCDAGPAGGAAAATVSAFHAVLGDALVSLHGRRMASFGDVERVLRASFDVALSVPSRVLEVRSGTAGVTVTVLEHGGEEWLALRGDPFRWDAAWCLDRNGDLVDFKIEHAVDDVCVLAGAFPMTELTAHRLVAMVEALGALQQALVEEHGPERGEG